MNKPLHQAKYFLLMSLVMGLTACGTSVPLSEPAKVEDRAPVPAVGSAPAGSGSSVAQQVQMRDVKPIEVTPPVGDNASNIIYFEFDSHVIQPQYQNALNQQAKQLAANRSAKLLLAGHTDESGGREYNLALGQKRAEAVKRALAILGGTEAQLEAVSYGKEKPAVTGSNATADEKNRRVEMVVR